MPETPFGDATPTTETQSIWFNASMSVVKAPDEELNIDDSEYRDIIATYVQAISALQPEIDLVGGEVLIREDASYKLESGFHSLEPRDDAVSIDDRIEIDAEFEQPVLVFSHIEDAQMKVRHQHDRFRPGDIRILPQGLLRDHRDEQQEEEHFDHALPLDTFL